MKALSELVLYLLMAILTGMGLGSGGLLLIYLTLVSQMEAVTARGWNLFFFAVSAFASLVWNAVHGRLPYRLLFRMLAIGMGGVALGALLLPYLSEFWMRKLLGAVLIAMAVGTLLSCRKKSEESPEILPPPLTRRKK